MDTRVRREGILMFIKVVCDYKVGMYIYLYRWIAAVSLMSTGVYY